MSDYRVSRSVGWAATPEGSVVVAHLPDGPPYVLPASAASIWSAAVEGGDAAAVVARVAELCGAAAEVVDADVRALLTQLVQLGLLQTSAAPARRPGPRKIT